MQKIKRLFITLTERCNMMCPHCWISAGPRRIDYNEITFSEISDSIESLIPFGLERVKLTGGEPFLRKELCYDIIDLCHKLGIYVSLETNASLFDENDYARLRNSRNLDIGISLDFPLKHDFDSFRHSDGAYNKVMECLDELTENLKITVAMAVFQRNLQLMEEIADIVVGKNGVVRYLLCMNIGRATQEISSDFLSPSEVLLFYKKIHQICTKYPNRVSSIIPWAFNNLSSTLKFGKCGVEENIGLLPDGTISFCGIGLSNEKARLGNIRSQKLTEIVEGSELMNQLCHLSEGGYVGICNKCFFKYVCGNLCPANVCETYGDFSHSFPVCQKLYEEGLFPKEFIVKES